LPDAAPLTAAEGGRQVERAHRSHVQEFYDYYAGELSVAAVNQALRAWELTYNTVRPHRALKLKSPLSYLRAEHPERAPPVSNVLNSYTRLHGLTASGIIGRLQPVPPTRSGEWGPASAGSGWGG
jgi:hypothetical protein